VGAGFQESGRGVVVNPIKLRDRDGSLLGAVIVPRPHPEKLPKEMEFHYMPPVSFSTYGNPNRLETVELRTVVLVNDYWPDAAMLARGTLYDFERCEGCFFIPGYDFTMKGRR
jgi:hypothetical protein